jgi:quercetin dioxygenase-like cupin family protein
MTASANDTPLEIDHPRFTVFHYRDGVEPTDSGAMAVDPGSEENFPIIGQCIEAGIMDGAENRLVFRGFGMSLVHIWFKPNYPLPRHSHDSDCLYYVTAGSLRLGTRDLKAGDGFFLPANVPYTYTAGPDGVELMEFRSTESFDYRDLTAPAFWARALQLTKDNHAAWQTARRPSGAALD